jgi:hypothetical protein
MKQKMPMLKENLFESEKEKYLHVSWKLFSEHVLLYFNWKEIKVSEFA